MGDTSRGHSLAEIMPAGDGTASGHWEGKKGAIPAQVFLGEDFRMQKGDSWTNRRARICAASQA